MIKTLPYILEQKTTGGCNRRSGEPTTKRIKDNFISDVTTEMKSEYCEAEYCCCIVVTMMMHDRKWTGTTVYGLVFSTQHSLIVCLRQLIYFYCATRLVKIFV